MAWHLEVFTGNLHGTVKEQPLGGRPAESWPVVNSGYLKSMGCPHHRHPLGSPLLSQQQKTWAMKTWSRNQRIANHTGRYHFQLADIKDLKFNNTYLMRYSSLKNGYTLSKKAHWQAWGWADSTALVNLLVFIKYSYVCYHWRELVKGRWYFL